MDLQLAGKRVLVTGGNRGIGKAVARRLIGEGVSCVLAGRDERALEGAADELRQIGGPVEIVLADMTDRIEIEAMVSRAAELMGGLDILINSAARSSGAEPEDFWNVDDELILEDFVVKFLGYLRVSRAAAQYMKASGWGRIVNIAGLGARSVGPISAGARNIAIAHLTACMAAELGPSGINCNTVHPGFTVTESLGAKLQARATREGADINELERGLAESVSIGRLVTADEVAAVIGFLVSPLAIALNGEAIGVGGGGVHAVYP